jgi:hypothetical protein
MAVNITTDTNTVTVTSTTTNKINIVDNGNNTSVSVSQPTTRVIKVATVGPQGPVGIGVDAFPYTGSAEISGSLRIVNQQQYKVTNVDIASDYAAQLRFFTSGSQNGLIYSSNPGQLVIASNDTIVNNAKIQGVFTGSLEGTASFATSASHAQGYVLNSSTSSFVTNSQTSSFVLNSSTSSFVTNSQTSSFVLNSSTSSFVTNSQTGSYASTGSVTFTGPQIVTGSTRGNVTALSITSNTASMNLSTGNFFTLQLVSGSNTYINPSNILPGQTSLLTLSTTGSATVSFPSFVKQPSGSAYIPTTSTGVDILTFVSVDSSTLYVANIKNMI